MYMKLLFPMLIINTLCGVLNCENLTNTFKKQPTILIVTLIRNKAHTLPYFLSLLDNLNYPKDRISLWFQSDHNEDNSAEVLNKFIDKVSSKYNVVYKMIDESKGHLEDEEGPAHWPPSRFKHVISLKEKALKQARKMWADYLFFLDADVFLTNPDVLKELIDEKLPIVSPMLKSDGMYSNFWCGMTEEYYYQRTDEYKPILERKNIDIHKVPMVHSAVLIDLRYLPTDKLTFHPDKVQDYKGPLDDIIVFAMSANISGISLHISNKNNYGYIMVPLEQGDTIAHDKAQLINIKLLILSEMKPIIVNDYLNDYVFYPQKDKLQFSEVYMINLKRRPERRNRMELCFMELGLDVVALDAVDGRSLSDGDLIDLGIEFMPGFADPYHNRPMTMGEIGCFLSHYNIWREVIDKGNEAVMVLEDDIRFEPFFRQKVLHLMSEIKQLGLEWDLIYLGRKRLQDVEEPWVQGSRYLVHAAYSYWTLGYLLSHRGAEKLLAGRPLQSMVPVDEYLPILFDKHPNEAWKKHFAHRDLIAFSAAPLLLYPTHYTGEKGYISDTEDSAIITTKSLKPHEDL